MMDDQPVAARLTPIRCGQCNTPVGHMDASVVGAVHKALCQRCKKDELGEKMRVYTFYRIVRGVPE